MKKIFKLAGYIIGGMIILGIIGSMIDSEQVTTTIKDPVTQEKVEVKQTKKDVITKVNFDTIVVGDILSGEGGMTIEQVVAIFGEPDSKTESESPGMNGEKIKMEMYNWTTIEFKAVGITFTNGLVSNKTWME